MTTKEKIQAARQVITMSLESFPDFEVRVTIPNIPIDELKELCILHKSRLNGPDNVQDYYGFYLWFSKGSNILVRSKDLIKSIRYEEQLESSAHESTI